MNLRNHLKFFSLISIVSIALIVSVVYVTQNVFVGLLVGLIADSIQIVTYVVWFFQKEVPMAEVPKQIEQIHKYVTLKEEKSRIKEELISRLVNEGAIGENELYSLIRNKEIILAFPYGEGVLQTVRELSGLNRPPLSGLLEQIGFVRVTRLQNLMVAFVDKLPKVFRKIDNLSLFIQEEVPKIWTKISADVKKKYPGDRYPKKFEKWREVDLTKLTFYGGVDEIGGNKILVHDRKTKVLFDFGQSFNFGTEYFTGWLSPLQ